MPVFSAHTASSPPLWLQMKRAGFKAGDILRHFRINTPKVEPEAIAKAMEVRVLPAETSVTWSGAVESSLSGDATVWLRTNEHPVRKRFTLAHELGHLMLHPTGTMFRDETFTGNAQETEANKFAASLLMPLWMLQPIAEHVRNDVDALSDIFGVSRAAMTIRLERLGVFVQG